MDLSSSMDPIDRLPQSDLVPARKNGLFLNVPAFFNVFLILCTLCPLDNLADSTDSGRRPIEVVWSFKSSKEK